MVKIFGILNITPDSFRDGGSYVDFKSAIDHAIRLVEDGADVIDVGGESTRPGYIPVSLNDELNRVIPIIEQLTKLDIPTSIDTTKPEIAERCLDLGTTFINDVSGLVSSKMRKLVSKYNIKSILMHSSQSVKDLHARSNTFITVNNLIDYFEQCLSILPKDKIILDPGFGFGKTPYENFNILNNLYKLTKFNCPIMLGSSGKTFINEDKKHLNDEEILKIGINNNATFVRLHNVRLAKQYRGLR